MKIKLTKEQQELLKYGDVVYNANEIFYNLTQWFKTTGEEDSFKVFKPTEEDVFEVLNIEDLPDNVKKCLFAPKQLRKAEEIIAEHYGCKTWEEVCKDFLSDISPTMIKEIVKIAQVEAIENTVKYCADRADADIIFLDWLAEHNTLEAFEEGKDYEVYVIYDSMIKCINELKKDL